MPARWKVLANDSGGSVCHSVCQNLDYLQKEKGWYFTQKRDDYFKGGDGDIEYTTHYWNINLKTTVR